MACKHNTNLPPVKFSPVKSVSTELGDRSLLGWANEHSRSRSRGGGYYMIRAYVQLCIVDTTNGVLDQWTAGEISYLEKCTYCLTTFVGLEQEGIS